MEEESSLTTPIVARPSQVKQEVSSAARNIPTVTRQPFEPSRGGPFKSRASKGSARGKRAREERGDIVSGGEAIARPLFRFKVDRHLTKMKEGELELIRDMYQVPDYVEFQLPGPTDQQTRPPYRHITVYMDYFWKGLWLPLHSFFNEALLNLDFSLPQLNPNVIQSLVALWVLYYINGFPDLLSWSSELSI